MSMLRHSIRFNTECLICAWPAVVYQLATAGATSYYMTPYPWRLRRKQSQSNVTEDANMDAEKSHHSAYQLVHTALPQFSDEYV